MSEIPQGAIRFNTDSHKLEFYAQGEWWIMSTDTPNLGQGSDSTPGARGLFGGGYSPTNPSQSNVIGYINIDSTGDAVDFGDLTVARIALGGLASRTRGVFGGGFVTPTNQDTIDFVTIASTGNATDFGNLTTARHWVQPGSSSTSCLLYTSDAADE